MSRVPMAARQLYLQQQLYQQQLQQQQLQNRGRGAGVGVSGGSASAGGGGGASVSMPGISSGSLPITSASLASFMGGAMGGFGFSGAGIPGSASGSGGAAMPAAPSLGILPSGPGISSGGGSVDSISMSGGVGPLGGVDGRGKQRKVSPEEIQRVQQLIERCLLVYMTQSETVTTLRTQSNVDPAFTNLVWQKLEEQNPDFFRAYHQRLKVKEQVSLFNFLVNQQAQVMERMQRGSVVLSSISLSQAMAASPGAGAGAVGGSSVARPSKGVAMSEGAKLERVKLEPMGGPDSVVVPSMPMGVNQDKKIGSMLQSLVGVSPVPQVGGEIMMPPMYGAPLVSSGYGPHVGMPYGMTGGYPIMSSMGMASSHPMMGGGGSAGVGGGEGAGRGMDGKRPRPDAELQSEGKRKKEKSSTVEERPPSTTAMGGGGGVPTSGGGGGGGYTLDSPPASPEPRESSFADLFNDDSGIFGHSDSVLNLDTFKDYRDDDWMQ